MNASDTISFSSSFDFSMSAGNCSPDDTLYLDDPYASFYLYQPIDKIMTFYIIPVISVFGILSNLAFILVVYKVPFMRSPTSCYMVQLAVSDTIFLLVAAVEKIVLVSSTPIQFDMSPIGFVPGCILLPGLLDTPYFASSFFITAVTFDRYIAICWPLRVRLQTKTRRAKVSLFSWLTAIVFAACLLPGFYSFLCIVPPEFETSDFPQQILECDTSFVPKIFYYVRYALQTLPFFVSLVIDVVLYVAILRAIRRRKKTMRSALTHSTAQLRHARNAVDRMVLVTGGLFFLLLSPLECYFIVISISEIFDYYPLSAEQEAIVIWVFRLLSYVNSSINPVVYNITNSRYREAFKMVFWRKTSKPENSSTSIFNIQHAAQRQADPSTSVTNA
ncbi:thyrotropin-releasing hormone receptor-like [Patiria miniata]|uniref:G-protein coupled receptors family 1 profile domain-containing protein n=1 Tax=Patiria miniata TaxID=46514 RepID=A0A913ZN24_PATMI|nr:thyrotropin-releasing hormone receptor-like [Patiria miniata]